MEGLVSMAKAIWESYYYACTVDHGTTISLLYMDNCENASVNELATESEGEFPSTNAVVHVQRSKK